MVLLATLRVFRDPAGNRWEIRKVGSEFAFVVAGLPPVWIEASGMLWEFSEEELLEILRDANDLL